ncbi:ATP-binding cassette domain-containing protein [Gracilimonas sp.]|uniref:ABC transporter ATP-binding protein n=1 Tax=Gracilimonas sp. TaxID=1974203 RepID=UPI0028710F34|nr:ABC transporter ATP-binding protein [Gracilimonas sp.]
MISLQVTNLTKKFNRHTVFKELNFEHESGVLGIAGSNGSGKSTLLKCLAYLLKPNKGEITWKNLDDEMDQKQVKAHIGYTAPYISLYDELSVFENLVFLLEVGGEKADEEILHPLLDRVQIPHLKDQMYGSLSTGQKQRAKLAAALVRDPDILMLDEPGSNLDKHGHELVSSIVKKAREENKLVFLASNDPNEISLCDEVVQIGTH